MKSVIYIGMLVCECFSIIGLDHGESLCVQNIGPTFVFYNFMLLVRSIYNYFNGVQQSIASDNDRFCFNSFCTELTFVTSRLFMIVLLLFEDVIRFPCKLLQSLQTPKFVLLLYK
jgi:hypothetical protein